MDFLLAALAEGHGYDFTGYARSSLKRRVARLLVVDNLPSFAELVYRAEHDEGYLKHLVEELTVNVTEMFRDPPVYNLLREKVLPVLATHPLIRIWHAGCATGEEVYSMAILLHEAGLLHKSLLYATDLNPTVIENIKRGIFPLAAMRQYSENYIASGGKADFSSYYTAAYDRARFRPELKARMIAATHNLVSDRSFNAFQLILCRNVLIYFNKELQDRVFTLFEESLENLGFLVLGAKENIKFSPVAPRFVPVGTAEKVWRKTK